MCVCVCVCVCVVPHVYRAPQQSSTLQGLLDDVEHVGRGLAEVVLLRDAPREVLKALGGGAARQGLITAIHSGVERHVRHTHTHRHVTHTHTHTCTHTHTHTMQRLST